jgi:hypothetical protein
MKHFVYVGVMYSGEYDVCDITLSVYIHTGQAETFAWIEHGGNRTRILINYGNFVRQL